MKSQHLARMQCSTTALPACGLELLAASLAASEVSKFDHSLCKLSFVVKGNMEAFYRCTWLSFAQTRKQRRLPPQGQFPKKARTTRGRRFPLYNNHFRNAHRLPRKVLEKNITPQVPEDKGPLMDFQQQGSFTLRKRGMKLPTWRQAEDN